MKAFPLRRRPLSLEVAHQLREAVLDGSLGPGAVVPTEAELALSFGVGRSTVREALRVVQAQGLITGGESTSTERPRVDPALAGPAATQALDAALRLASVDVADLVAVRVLLECQAVKDLTAVPAEADAALTVMSDAVGAGDVDAFHAADVAFHLALCRGSRNPAIAMLVEVMRNAISRHLLERLRADPAAEATMGTLLEEHLAIAAAVRAKRSATAARLVAAHIEGFYEQHG